MADKKISALTALAQGDVAVSTDVLPIVDISATETKKIAVNALVGAAAAAGLTNVDINSGTIDGATIATSDITVGAGKTLNVSAGTLTLADNQISGDKVEGGTINAITINTLTSTAVNATTVDATNVEITNIKAKDGTAAGSIADSTGIVTLASSVLTTTDINGGSIDGTTIGANSAAAGNFTTVDTTNIEVTNLKAKDGTTAGSIADATGVVTLGSSVLTTTDINGGTIDGTTIGGSSAAAGTFTTLTTSSTVTFNGGTANGVLYLNGSKVATSGSALTFDGTNFATTGRATANDFLASGGAFYTVVGGTTYGSLIATAGTLTLNANNGTGLIFSVASTEGMRLTSTGLGIGTASPGYKLSVAGASGSAVLNLLESGVRSWGIRAGGTATNTFDIADFTAGATRLTIDSSGNLGIGTSSPATRLQVNGGYISQSDGTITTYLGSDGTGSLAGTTTNHYFRFITNNTERARITSGGDLLVGTSAAGGSASNTTRVTGGIFSTFNATPSIASGTATTVATLPSGEGMYLVSASLLNSGTAADWNELALVRVSQSNTAVSTIVGAVNLDITVSGLNVQVEQRQGATQTIPVAIIRIM